MNCIHDYMFGDLFEKKGEMFEKIGTSLFILMSLCHDKTLYFDYNFFILGLS